MSDKQKQLVMSFIKENKLKVEVTPMKNLSIEIAKDDYDNLTIKQLAVCNPGERDGIKIQKGARFNYKNNPKDKQGLQTLMEKLENYTKGDNVHLENVEIIRDDSYYDMLENKSI
jgi:hypothetical protein